jgi:hypothetical protein
MKETNACGSDACFKNPSDRTGTTALIAALFGRDAELGARLSSASPPWTFRKIS